MMEDKQEIIIYMDKQIGWKLLRLRKQECSNLNTLKKKILNLYDYEQSQGKKIKLSIMQVYPTQPQDIHIPIFNDQNLKTIVKFLLKCHREIKVFVQCNQDEGVLEKKQMLSKEAIEQGQIHFDQNGSLIQENDEMIKNIPEDPKCDNQKHVRCQFCQKNTQDVQYLKRCGGLYGPFGNQKQKYVHLLCALWCHQVYLDKQAYLKEVQAAIDRSIKIKCKFCSEKGAGLVCVGKRMTKKGTWVDCKKKYHFKCAYDSGCKMNWLSYKMLCSVCKNDEQNMQQLNKHNAKSQSIQSYQEQFSEMKIEQNILDGLREDIHNNE